MFSELHDLDSTLHETTRQHVHCVRKSIIYKILLHLCHVCDATIGQFLKPGVVYVGPVHGNDISIVIIRGLQHKAVIGCGWCELDVRRHELVSVDIGVHFYTTLLFPGLGMPAYASHGRQDSEARAWDDEKIGK